MNEADRIAYEAFEKSLLAALKPVEAYERQLAVSISQDHWRINRSRAIEFNTLGLGHEELCATGQHPGRTNIVLYETRATLIARIQRKADLAAARFYKSVAWNRAAQLPDHYRFPRPAAHQLKKAA